jgi:transposase
MEAKRICLAPPERRELESRARSRTLRAEDVRRARLILCLARGDSYSEICDELSCNRHYVSCWKTRFLEERIAGLYSRHRGRPVEKRTPKLEAKILEWTRRKPTDGSTHWSTRKLAKKLGVSHMMVARVWARAGLQPHRVERYMASNDPDFETKAADIIGLYIKPPQHAAVFCVDEKTAIQALDRLDPVLPLSPGRAERHGFEYYRHGTLSLYAALNTKTGTVIGKTAARHTSAEFVSFLSDLVASQPRRREIHVIADNLSAHKTKLVREFLRNNKRVHIHYTPTYSSWLNQVELWFAKIERDVIARGIFTSVADLRRKLMRYIRHYNKAPKPIKWMYRDPTNRFSAGAKSVGTVH